VTPGIPRGTSIRSRSCPSQPRPWPRRRTRRRRSRCVLRHRRRRLPHRSRNPRVRLRSRASRPLRRSRRRLPRSSRLRLPLRPRRRPLRPRPFAASKRLRRAKRPPRAHLGSRSCRGRLPSRRSSLRSPSHPQRSEGRCAPSCRCCPRWSCVQARRVLRRFGCGRCRRRTEFLPPMRLAVSRRHRPAHRDACASRRTHTAHSRSPRLCLRSRQLRSASRPFV
jgi:hypothetical protein